MKKLLILIILIPSMSFAQSQPEAERAMLILQQLSFPASQAEMVVELKKEIYKLQDVINKEKKAITECNKKEEKK